MDTNQKSTHRYRLWREVYFLDSDGVVEFDHDDEDEVVGVDWKGNVVRVTYIREVS